MASLAAAAAAAAAMETAGPGPADAAVLQANTIRQRLGLTQLADARVGTLQHVAAPICWADLVSPGPFAGAVVIPVPGKATVTEATPPPLAARP